MTRARGRHHLAFALTFAALSAGSGTVALVGCADPNAAPVVAAKEFAAAVQRRDAGAVIARLDASSVEALQVAAERASDQVGGRRTVDPSEMLQLVDVDPEFFIERATLMSLDGGRATVALSATNGSVEELTLVLEEGEWRVSVPLPAVSGRTLPPGPDAATTER